MRPETRYEPAARSRLACSRNGIVSRIAQRVAIALVVTLSFSCASHVTTVTQQQRSPDGRFIAYLELLVIEGGADFMSRVVIAPSSEPFDKERAEVWIFQANLALSAKSIAWRGDHQVDVVLAGPAINLPVARMETRERDGVNANVIIVN
jgi:hypothetical protein